MASSENTMSLDGQHALQDMVEGEMYLMAQSRQTPWHMFPRRNRKSGETRTPNSNVVESSVVQELLDRQLIEATSNQTFVVSKSGLRVYDEMKSNLNSMRKGTE